MERAALSPLNVRAQKHDLPPRQTARFYFGKKRLTFLKARVPQGMFMNYKYAVVPSIHSRGNAMVRSQVFLSLPANNNIKQMHNFL